MKMKTLLVALGFSLIFASSQLDPAEINGDWRTIYVATDNPEKIEEGGELRIYMRHLECSENCDQIAVVFYIKLNQQCQKFSVVGMRSVNDVYEAEYSGKNFFQIKYISDGVIGFYNENEDIEGKVTHSTAVTAKQSSLSEEEQKRFQELTEEMNIPKENIRNVAGTDDCPAA